MRHVSQPLFDEQDAAPLHVVGQLLRIGDGQALEVSALRQFLGQVEDRQEQV
jgi:hypothetical protein